MKTQKPKNRLRYWLNLSIAALLFTLLIYYIFLAYSITKPANSEVKGPTPSEWPASYEETSISLADGAVLSGWYVPSNNGKLIILLHGYGANRLQMAWHAQVLVREGYGIFMYDQRASGESSGDFRSWGWQDVDDMKFILDYFSTEHNMPNTQISLIGASTGAEIAILSMERYPNLDKVIADGAGYSVASDLPPNRSFSDKLITAPVGLVLKMVEIGSGIHPKSSIVQAINTIDPSDILLISTGNDSEKLMNDYYCSILGDGCQHWNVPYAAHTLVYQVEPEEYTRRMLFILE